MQRGTVSLLVNLGERRLSLPRPAGDLVLASTETKQPGDTPFVLEPESCYIFVAGTLRAADA
jgi:hypothetical protein